jgi:uncharacterized protein YdeI (YjbR/CyaY-like superfamily)
MTTTKPELPTHQFEDGQSWETWLEENHATSSGVWLQLAKKKSLVRTVTYLEAVEVALCYGWIDGQGKALDDCFSLQKFTPRGKKSVWSKINVGRAKALEAAGRMRTAGRLAIDQAKADGRWDAAYDSPRTATVPDDLQAALDSDPEAGAFFASLPSSGRFAILYRLQTAKLPATRERRLKQFVEMLRRGEKL